MAKLNEEALDYTAPTTKNIADLEVVATDLDVLNGIGKNSETGEDFKFKYIIVDEIEYRVPGSVLGSLKAILQKKPDLKLFTVTKQGAGMNTKYTVIPL